MTIYTVFMYNDKNDSVENVITRFTVQYSAM